jgi:hypothetical protein
VSVIRRDIMGIDFVDASGQLRPSEEIEAALLWVKKRILRPDFKDPEGVGLCITIKDALEELLAIRGIMAKAKAESMEMPKPKPWTPYKDEGIEPVEGPGSPNE